MSTIKWKIKLSEKNIHVTVKNTSVSTVDTYLCQNKERKVTHTYIKEKERTNVIDPRHHVVTYLHHSRLSERNME